LAGRQRPSLVPGANKLRFMAQIVRSNTVIQYGAGSVIVWDRGHWIPKGDRRKGYANGHLKFSLRGEKLGGN